MKKRLILSAMIAASMTLVACNNDTDASVKQDPEPSNPSPSNPSPSKSAEANLKGKSKAWFDAGSAKVAANAEEVKKIVAQAGKAKNVILFVGDGMGVSTVTAARIFEGQQKGGTGEENLLSFENMPFSGLVKTYNTNQQTPDSAGTATAMVTGVKTKAGVIGVSDKSNRATCAGAKGQKGTELVTALELAKMAGKSTGVVTTARLTHATPASTYAKSSERGWESNDKLTDEAKTNGCTDIAAQFVASDSIDVAFGGGRRHFIPKEVTDLEGKKGKRTDAKNLTQEWVAKTKGTYVEDQKGFDAIPANATKVLGLFNSSHMRYEADRKNDKAGEPSLTDMTSKAIDLLSKNDKGYVMMVESGRIDHAHHAGNAAGALTDTVEFAKAIKAAMDKTSPEDTLIIVTADHSHVFTMAGYPTRGNPILGKVVGNDSNGKPESKATLAKDDQPYTTLGYTNGRGFMDLGDETDSDKGYGVDINTGRKLTAAVDTTKSGYHQEALVPNSAETHAGEDVGIYARGPGAHLVSGTIEQNVIFHVMNHAANLVADAEAAQ